MKLFACVLVLVASSAFAQTKPIGAFSSDGAPGWITFGTISGESSDAEILAAARRSQATGFQWIVQIGYHAHPLADAGDVAAAVRARFDRVGLWPFVVATTYGEEWHERCLGGEFAYLGIPAWSPACGDLVVQWFSVQHARVKAATGKPVMWITGMVVPGRLVPSSTDYVAIDYYPADGQDFSAVLPVYALAERHTALPIVAVARWFKSTGPFQGPAWQLSAGEPPAAWAQAYAELLTHPRVVALLGFLWASRPYAELVGLADMPAQLAAVKKALGVP